VKPSIGRIVHFVIPWEGRVGVHRPAIVTSVDYVAGGINLNVLLDEYDVRNDIGGFHTNVCVQNVELDSTGTLPGTWHWPEQVD
jgi:hypothetical protein